MRHLAREQGGVITRRQALGAGFHDYEIQSRIASGRWLRLFSGVHLIDRGPPARESLFWAAVLYAGHGAVLSHTTAAETIGLIPTPQNPLHVMVPHRRIVAPQPGLVIHRSRRVDQARHPARVPPQTRVEETVFDLTQASTSVDQAHGWLVRACGERLTTAGKLRQALSQRERLRWRRELTEAIDDVDLGCHSALELLYLRVVERAHGLPRGSRQAPGLTPDSSGANLHRRYDDVLYAGWQLVVELDGRVAHALEHLDRDRRRDNATIAAGSRVLRYGWVDLTKHPCVVAIQVTAALRLGGWRGDPRPCCPTCPVS